MIEIRTYDGDGEDVAELTARAWRAAYGGVSWCPYWSAESIRWQLLSACPDDRDFLVAAYNGCRLVGCFFAKRTAFQISSRQVLGTIGSWFTVDPEAGSPRLGMAIVEELRRRHVEYGVAFLLGYVNGGPNTPANKFWKCFAKLYPDQIRFVRKIGYWIRILNPSSLRRKCVHWFERFIVGVHGILPLLGAPPRRAPEVRDYVHGDSDRCGRLVGELSKNADLAMTWSSDRIATQLDWNGFPRTLVLDHNGETFGIVNYHPFGLLGKEVVSTGLIDLLGCGSGSAHDQRRLLRSAIAQMDANGLDIAMALRTSMFPPRVMLPCGFWPMPQSEHLVYAFPQPGLDLPPADRPLILFR
ncbi:MAG: hypothetical protein HY287_01055 [Planctomycetes bacterium]|nr:hypothetical protein [Planctomycetota bacterium]MBI3832896.1 hypothetical protein [Planctomycetota bacterium]